MTENKQILVLFGSETGNCEAISKRIHQEALGLGYKSKWHKLDDFKKIGLDTNPWPNTVIIVTSSTGNGDPPENGENFWLFIGKRTHPDTMLANVNFSMLGLGDTNYDTYQGFPRKLHKRLVELGAKPFQERCEADEATGLEETVEPYVTELWSALEAHFTSLQKQVTIVPQAAEATTTAPAPVEKKKNSKLKDIIKKKKEKEKAEGNEKPVLESVQDHSVPKPPPQTCKVVFDKTYSKELPMHATLVEARKLTTKEAVKQVWEMTLDVGREIQYKVGDSIGVVFPNNEEIVDKLIVHLKLNPDALLSIEPLDASADTSKYSGKVSVRVPGTNHSAAILPNHIKTPCSVREALLHYCDIQALPSKRFLRMLADYSSAEDKEKLIHMCSTKGRDDYVQEIEAARLTLLELLERFPSCQPPLAHLFDSLPPLKPRYYSIASSPLVHRQRAHFAFTVVDVPIPNTTRRWKGTCSNWLAELCEVKTQFPKLTLRVPMFSHPTKDFVLPASHATPIIMVGPGTGVAPFIGFLEERRQIQRQQPTQKFGASWLFFGCRHPDYDYLYRTDLEEFEKDGTLTKLVPAFSRFEENKVVYVQHRLQEYSSDILDLMLNNNAHFYICGDASGMAKAVRETLVQILKDQGGKSESEAHDTITSWSQAKRFVLDIWS